MNPQINKSLAANIKKLRTLKGVDTKSIADHLGISTSAYSRMERGETQIDMERIATIAEKLGVEVSDILSFSPNNIFEKIDNSNVSTAVNIDTQNQYAVPKEIIDSLTRQLEEKDQQIARLMSLLEKK